MMFVQSLHGISHNKIEDTKEEHIELAVIAFDQARGNSYPASCCGIDGPARMS